jgi:hypothetical protein
MKPPDTPHALPVAVELYLRAPVKSAPLLANCFTHDAILTHQGRLFKGLASLCAWQEEMDLTYPGYRTELLFFAPRGHAWHASVRYSSAVARPMVMRHRFRMRGDGISELHVGVSKD